MEFTISREEFLKGLQRVQGIVSTKGPMPILANVLIETGSAANDENLAEGGAGADTINIFATNLDIGLRGTYKADVAAPGRVTVQAKKLHDIVRELPDDEIRVKVDDDGRCRVMCGRSKFNLATIDAEEFPSFPRHDRSKMTGLDCEMLGDMIRKTSYAISQDETRMTLNGAYFEIEPTRVRMVATDGHRLGYVEREGAFGVTEKTKFIIARKAVTELAKIIGESDGTLHFCQHDNHAVFVIDSTLLGIRLIEGAYPNYEQVIPKSHEHKAVINADEFLHSLRRVATLADEKSHMIRLQFSEGKVELISEGGDIGEAKDELPIEYEGGELTVGLNAYYLVDVLGIINQENVILKMQDQLSPVKAESPGDAGLLCIVMPMRL